MKLLVVDGNSILNRAYYGIRPLTTKDGQFTNGIYGFLTMFEKIKTDVKPDFVAIAFDMRAPTFRHKAYAGYKAQRKGMPEELASQLQPLKDLLGFLGYKIVTCEGYEADDILGTLAAACERQGGECVLATGDRDSFQLITEKTTVRFANSARRAGPLVNIYGVKEIIEEYGVEPKALIEIKALQGDSSDNIPGVAGIGQKNAKELIKKYGSVEYIYNNLSDLDINDSMWKRLVVGEENARLSRMLGEICCTAPVDTRIENYSVGKGEPRRALELMQRLELFKLIERFGIRELAAKEPPDEKPTEINGKLTVVNDAAPENAEKISLLPVFDETEIAAVYVCAEDEPEKVYVISEKEKIKSILADTDTAKQTYSSKPLFAFADKNGFELKNVDFDISLAAYLLNPSSSDYSIERLCDEYFIIPAEHGDKNAVLCSVMPVISRKLLEDIRKHEQEELLRNMEIPLAKVLAEMENRGFRIDREGIEKYGEKMEAMIKEIQSQIYEAVGYEFNINSPKQLGTALFEKLGLPAKKKNNRGYSTDAEVLEELSRIHPVADMILNYRAYAKLKSTYCDGLLKVVAPDGRIHSNFNQTETRTGRISSTEPNLQNIPVRTDIGRELRRFFCAEEGMVLVDADYSQIELRVLAHLADDKNMKEAFKSGFDIHTNTASQVFNIPAELVTPLMRSRAKAVNFGIVYGIGAYSLAKDIGVTNREAANYIKAYLDHYSGVAEYMERMIERATELGYAETMFGRRRYLPELTVGNHNTRAFGQRVARNMPIQGTAADIIKIAMIKVSDRLRREDLRARLILQVHDELIVEAPVDEAERVKALLQEEMENAVNISVPLTADAYVGKTWYDAKG